MSDGLKRERVPVGVVGLGFMGATHLAAYTRAAEQGLCEIVAVSDKQPERRAGRIGTGGNLDSGSTAAAFDVERVRAYETPQELFADDEVQLVSICTPTESHAELTEQTMRAGKHVLLEKPVAVRAETVRYLAGVARECGTLCMPAMCMRFWPAWTWLRDTVQTKRFGEVLSARFTRLGTRPGWSDFYADEQRSGGALIDLHVHDADYICSLFGPPTAVSSTGNVSHLTTAYTYANVPHVVAEGGWDQHAGFGFVMRFVVNFEQATLDFDIGRGERQLLLCRDGAAEAVSLPAELGYDVEIRHLLECIAAGTRPDVSLDDAFITHSVLDAERASLESGRPVELHL